MNKTSKMKLEDLPDLLDAEIISAFLGLSYNSTLKLIKYNMVHVKLGRYYRVTKNNFLTFINQDHNVEAVLKPK